MQTPQRILIRCVNWLGDAVMITPALMRLRERFPAAYIAMLTPAKLQDLWQNHPAVNEVIVARADTDPLTIGHSLREKDFELALVLPNSPRSALEMWCARIPERVGYARPWRNWLLTRAVPTRPGHVEMQKPSVAEIKRRIADPTPVARPPIPAAAHQINEYLFLVGALGANPEPLPPCLEVTAGEIRQARQKFGLPDAAAGKPPVFGLNCGAEYGPAKRWPIERFIAVAKQIQAQTNCTWLLFGGKADMPLTAEITATLQSARLPVHDLAGKTSLRELMALLKACRLLLTNDTGPMHLAAALGTPVVVPFGSTSPELTAPGLPGDPRHRLIKSDAACSPCFLRECPIDFRCMNGITVERVVEEVVKSVK